MVHSGRSQPAHSFGKCSRHPCRERCPPSRCSLVNGRILRITVTHNGEGIAPENLTRVFSHGFTTRKNGHGHGHGLGLGLHSCALAAQEMGGSLSAHSDGSGQGE